MKKSTLYLEHFQLSWPPFGQEPDTHIFFPVAGRTTILKNLLTDLEEGQQLVKLTGSEGTGKTLMCRLLEHALDTDRFRLVSLEHPIGSYDNLLRTVCHVLEPAAEDGGNEGEIYLDYVSLFRKHLRRLKDSGRNLVILIDEAENLFLATLERLVRLICNGQEDENFQVLLVGRLELDANLDQLAVYCANVDINAGYTLSPLNLDETRQYIQFRLQGADIPGNKHQGLFTDEAIEMIYQVAMGNISLTNSLAEQGLKSACAKGMFQVADVLIEPQQGIEENVSFAFSQGLDFLRDNKWWLLAGVLLVWAILMLLWPVHEKQDAVNVEEEKLEIIMPEEEIVAPPEPDVSGSEESLPGATVDREPAMAPQSETQSLKDAKATTAGEKKEPWQEKSTEPRKETVVQPDKKKRVVKNEQIPERKVESTPARDGDALFDERLRASSAWLAWAYRGEYTIQLMVLASGNAEENLKQILVDDKYYEIKDQLYILRKISPKTIYVYYGNFSGMDEARQARNRMPPFLKDNQPYALSIQDAMKKIEE